MLRKAWVKAVVWALALAPAVWLAWRLALIFGLVPPETAARLPGGTDIIANPLEYVTHWTGDWTIRFLCFSLAITPLRKLLRLPDLIRFRRMLGLFAFFYGSLHFLTWLWLDKLFNWSEMLKDVAKRPFITAGMAGLLLMLPLAVTSTAGWIRRLGGHRWRALHRLVYASAVAGVIHYYWLVKADIRWPVFYGVVVGVLLLYRAAAWAIGKKSDGRTRVAQRTVAPVS